jgi:hypothetical protein
MRPRYPPAAHGDARLSLRNAPSATDSNGPLSASSSDLRDCEPKGDPVAASYDYFISGDHAAARTLIQNTLTQQGFAVEQTENGGFVAKRGSMGATVWLGALAGKNFHVSFSVHFFVDERGQLVARLNRNMGAGVLKGGAIGASKTDTAFVDTANALAGALTNAGVLTGSLQG